MNIKDLSKKQSQALYTVIGLVIFAIICVVISQLYSSHNNEKMADASTAYQKALIANENPKTSDIDKTTKFEKVADEYPNTSFGIFASWHLADLYVSPTKLDTGTFNLNLTNLPKAIAVLQTSADANPKDSLTNITKTKLAKLYIASKEPQKAIAMIETVEYYNKNAYPLMLLGQAYNESGDKTKAIQTWQKALDDPSSSPEFKEIITQFINNSK